MDIKNNHWRLTLLESRLNKLHKVLKDAYLEIFDIKTEITLIIRPVVQKELIKDKNKENFNKLLKIISDYYNIQPSILISKTIKREFVRKRVIFCYILKSYYNIVESEIANLYKSECNYIQDRSTIFHHIEAFKGTLHIRDNSLNMISEYNDILQILREKENTYE